ncbi:MAG: hypothetical protein ACRCU6_02045 [Fusobacteriaceae bacterium]
MSPRDRVRANIYKNLLEEEQSRSQRYRRVSLSLFFVGIFGTSSYYNFLKNDTASELTGKHIVILKNSPVESKKTEKIELEDFFNAKIFEDNQKINIDTEHVFGFDFQS